MSFGIVLVTAETDCPLVVSLLVTAVIGKTTFGRSLTDTIRKLGCGFLLAFHSNYGSILHHFRDREILVENHDFFHIRLAFDVPIGILSSCLV